MYYRGRYECEPSVASLYAVNREVTTVNKPGSRVSLLSAGPLLPSQPHIVTALSSSSLYAQREAGATVLHSERAKDLALVAERTVSVRIWYNQMVRGRPLGLFDQWQIILLGDRTNNVPRFFMLGVQLAIFRMRLRLVTMTSLRRTSIP